jgi:sulfopyruvate decarboxylase TPP-binding subunit
MILEELKRNHVTHVIGLPDNSSAMLLSLLSTDQDVRLISVTREGEAFAIAAGLWIGGKVPVVVVQNTGFLESGDSFRGTITRMRVPLVSLITYRGYTKLSGWRKAARGRALDAESLSRADLDSAALITEATLKAWGLPFDFLHGDEDVAKISEAFRKSKEGEQPFAILITQDMT